IATVRSYVPELGSARQLVGFSKRMSELGHSFVQAPAQHVGGGAKPEVLRQAKRVANLEAERRAAEALGIRKSIELAIDRLEVSALLSELVRREHWTQETSKLERRPGRLSLDQAQERVELTFALMIRQLLFDQLEAQQPALEPDSSTPELRASRGVVAIPEIDGRPQELELVARAAHIRRFERLQGAERSRVVAGHQLRARQLAERFGCFRSLH